VCVARRRRGSERRRWERIPLAIPLFLRGSDDQGREFLDFSTALNISGGGLLLASRRHLHSSSRVSMEIPSAPLSRPGIPGNSVRTLEGRVVRVTHTEHCYLSGLRFTPPLF